MSAIDRPGAGSRERPLLGFLLEFSPRPNSWGATPRCALPYSLAQRPEFGMT